MPPNCYKVEVIYYLNPHLIWVLVSNPSVEKKEFSLEQIGVYGVLPLEKTLGFLDHGLGLGLISQKCEDWLPAVGVMMKKFFDSSHEVWFEPTHIERKSSIFDDNIHKYGELVIKTKCDKLKKLSKYLIDSGFAYDSVSEFHEKLSCGKLKTKLNSIITHEVIKNLENYVTKNAKTKEIWKNTIKQQTSVFHLSQNFESSLTLCNMGKQDQIINKMLRNKLKDFELCKDVEEKSLGRACHKRKPKEERKVIDESSINLNVLKTKNTSQSPKFGDQAPRSPIQFLEDNAKANRTHVQQKESLMSRKLKLFKKIMSKTNSGIC